VIKVRTKLAIGIGAVVAIFVIVFCALPLQEVSYQGIEKYLAPEGYNVEEPYSERMPYTVQTPYIENGETRWKTTTEYREVTLYQDATGQSYVWQERPVTLYKKVSFLEALIGGY
jgi:hypothetical protein